MLNNKYFKNPFKVKRYSLITAIVLLFTVIIVAIILILNDLHYMYEFDNSLSAEERNQLQSDLKDKSYKENINLPKANISKVSNVIICKWPGAYSCSIGKDTKGKYCIRSSSMSSITPDEGCKW